MCILCYISNIYLSEFLYRLLNYLFRWLLFFDLRFFRNYFLCLFLLLLLHLRTSFFFTLFFNLLWLFMTLGWFHIFSGGWFHFFSRGTLLSENISPIYLAARYAIHWLTTFLHFLSCLLTASSCCFGLGRFICVILTDFFLLTSSIMVALILCVLIGLTASPTSAPTLTSGPTATSASIFYTIFRSPLAPTLIWNRPSILILLHFDYS